MKNSLIQHPPESEIVLDRMSETADLLIEGKYKEATRSLLEADTPTVVMWYHEYAQVQKLVLHENGISDPPKAPSRLKNTKQHKPSTFRQVLQRDCFHCRFCGIRVIVPAARKRIAKLLPGIMKWGDGNLGKHSCMVLQASPDHVLPKSWGGSNEMSNLVTACYPCQFSRMECRISDCQINNPFHRPPVEDGWDGLMRVLKIRFPR